METKSLKKLLKQSISKVLVVILLAPLQAMASACCGGAFSLPSVITGDDAAQLSTSFSQSTVQADVSADGVWSRRVTQDRTQTLKIDAARIFLDRWQAGFSLPVQIHDKEGYG